MRIAMKRGREYNEFGDALVLQFHRHVFNVPRPLNLVTHNMCYELSISRLDDSNTNWQDGKDAYNVIRAALSTCMARFMRLPMIRMASRLKEHMFVREIWAFLRKRLGRDVANTITDLVYRPTHERLMEISETLIRNDCGPMKRTGCIQHYPDTFPWGHKLLKRL